MTAPARDATSPRRRRARPCRPTCIRQVPDGVPARDDVVPGGDPRGSPRGDACATSPSSCWARTSASTAARSASRGRSSTSSARSGCATRPISENTIVGAATGAALVGMRPVAEIMFVDFAGLAMDQIATQAAKLRFMTGGQCRVPWVLRMPQGGGAGKSTAAQHSQSLEVWFAHIPGLKVVLPSTPYDAKGLLKAAIRDDNPVIFLEHKLLYAFKGLVPGRGLRPAAEPVRRQAHGHRRDRRAPRATWSGTPCWRRRCWRPRGSASRWSTSGRSPRSTRRPSAHSARKTGRVVVVAEACRGYGPANEWAMVAMEQSLGPSCGRRSSASPGATRRSRSPTASRTASGRAPRTWSLRSAGS